MGHETGVLDILSTGRGHLRLSFASDDAIEVTRARRAVTDMLRRGYALFLEGEGGTMTPVEQFDATRDVYVIADTPPVDPPAATPDNSEATPKRRGRPTTREVAASQANAVAVGRSAGG